MIVTVSALIAFLVNHFWDKVGLDKIFGEFETGDEGVELEWKSGGQGLELTIVNSLTNDWDQYFTESIVDWSASPSLSLNTVVKKGSQNGCIHRNGELTVCNAEYGKTPWTGLNEYAYYMQQGSDTKYIFSSVAIMNDTYLNGRSNAEKLFVMW